MAEHGRADALQAAMQRNAIGLQVEERAFAMARHFVRIAGGAAEQVARTASHEDRQAAVQAALLGVVGT
jgi:hypothetical protein